MVNKGMGGHERAYQGKSYHWLTPQHILKPLGPFFLDPCAAPAPRPWPTAKHMIEPPSNGLFVKWTGRIWLNPPYGPDTGKWLEKLALHGNGIALIFARTETKAFQKFVWEKADTILFLYSRIRSVRLDGSTGQGPGAPSCLVAYGQRNVKALAESGIPGAFVQDWLI